MRHSPPDVGRVPWPASEAASYGDRRDRPLLEPRPGIHLVENLIQPSRSLVSEEGGQTWRSDDLGDNNRADGEYVVRLWLDQSELTDEACSESIDLRQRHGSGRHGQQRDGDSVGYRQPS